MPLAAGQTLSLLCPGLLGGGGMGEVYRARDTRLEGEVAIKILSEDLADDEERLRRFEREAASSPDPLPTGTGQGANNVSMTSVSRGPFEPCTSKAPSLLRS